MDDAATVDDDATVDCFLKVGVFSATVGDWVVFFLSDAWWMEGICTVQFWGFLNLLGLLYDL